MVSKEASFSSSEYWDERFRKDREVFDWLLPESSLDQYINEVLSLFGDATPLILHIGSGTSLLSFHLKDLVHEANHIHNVDFSQEAIEWGKSKERELQCDGTSKEKGSMNWSQVSLLSLTSMRSLCKPATYSLIIDKSTFDAISCGPDIEVSFPYALYTPDEVSLKQDDTSQLSHHIHPLNVLALHLALITHPGSRWINLSYSSERFPFLPHIFGPPSDPVPEGFPDPARFWKLIQKKEIQTEQKVENSSGHVVHRPIVSHFVYVLERTSLRLRAPDMLIS